MSKQRHFLWTAYEALADRNDLTEPEGRATLKATFPHLADIVDFVIETKGDLKAAESAEAMVQSQQMSQKLRSEFIGLRNGSRPSATLGLGSAGETNGSGNTGMAEAGGANGSGNPGTAEGRESGDMNAIIRGFAGANRVKLGG